MLKFNESEMKKYFESEFDYIDYKYGPFFKEENKKDDKERDKIIATFKKGFVQFERAKNHNLYEKTDYNQIHERLNLIYKDTDEAEPFIFMYDFSLDQLIDRYINIPSLDKLFSHLYFEYEWEQHVDMNFEKNELSFYRDHFIHQVRNCYMVMKYFDFSDNSDENETHYNKIVTVLKLRTNSISQYACVQVEQYADYVMKRIMADYVTYASEFDDVSNKKVEDVINLMISNCENFAWNYLVRGSLIVAALFHDIGYPVRYVYKSLNAVSDYISLVNPADNIGFDKLNDLLESSILFKTVNKDELRSRYEALDHGALSAFILLLQFYETGAIRELDPIKKAIIELAAVIAYDHTLKYRFLGDGEGNTVRDKPSFKDAPLSYTLRFVDDIQEWGRMYFQIENSADYCYCEKCKMPIVSTVWNDLLVKRVFEDLQKDNSMAYFHGSGLFPKYKIRGDESYKYFSSDYFTGTSLKKLDVCGCDGYKGSMNKPYYADYEATKKLMASKIDGHLFNFGNIENASPFPYQRINYTMTCQEVSLQKIDGVDYFYIDYDPYSQLYLLMLDHNSLRYRIKEIAKLSKQFKQQAYIKICVRTHITDNPLMLKMRVLCNFIYEVGTYFRFNPDYAYNYYNRNMVYYGMFKDIMSQSGKVAEYYDYISKFVTHLKDRGFFVNDYKDELSTDDVGLDDPVDFDRINDVLQQILWKAVDFMIWPAKTRKLESFKDNLKNTVSIYLKILIGYLKSEKKDEEWYTLFTKENNQFFHFEYIDDVHKGACRIILRDFVSQLYYQTNGKMETYYELRSKKSSAKKWDNADYVVGEKEMEYALDVVFDKKYYNPMIMMTAYNVNNGKLNFFDINSDMYLLKEMSRFSTDNRRRRPTEKKLGIGQLYEKLVSECLKDYDNVIEACICALRTIATVYGEAYLPSTLNVSHDLTIRGYATEGLIPPTYRSFSNPYIYRKGSLRANETYIVSETELNKCKDKDPALKNAFDSKSLIWADGHVLRYDMKFVEDFSGDFRPSPYALLHMDECALKFMKNGNKFRTELLNEGVDEFLKRTTRNDKQLESADEFSDYVNGKIQDDGKKN